MKVHKLKIWPEYFNQLVTGFKTFELRKNDRDFCAGDLLLMQETNYDTQIPTGNFVILKVKSILSDFNGLHEGYCIMSIEHIPMEEA